ncbi:heavy metal translocating P-type ATPase [Saccharothrix sp. NPDC042600]|uniref:heavy metal translocating P-type ATPase n=1 Tax=Saccharothrix TaxID=2071 RepID=UPI003402477A
MVRVGPARVGVWALAEVRWACAATALFALGLGAWWADAPAWLWWSLLLACCAAGGWEPALAGLRALRERSLDVDLLMVVAAAGAAAIGQVVDGALLIVIFATSGALEAVLTRRTADSVRALLDLAPQRATRVVGDGHEEVVDASALRVDDEVVVRPGERVGADGVVVGGAGEVDEASITGEPLPVAKAVGAEVFAGTLNGSGALRVRVTRDPADSVLARIVSLVERASATKAGTQLLIEKVEQRYSVGVVVATLALFAVPLAFGAELRPTLLRAMTFMIVASPCALVLATMPPLLAAIANAGRHGVLVKSAVAMERLGAVTAVAVDKTGTLTEGRPRVVEVSPGDRADEVLAWAAAVERWSEHPVAAAIVARARERGLAVAEARDFRATPGVGVAGVVDGRRVAVVADPRAAGGGRTAVRVEVDGQPVGVVVLADRVRPSSRDAVAGLAAVTGSRPVLLSGDNSPAAREVAAEVGIEDARGGLLPQDKADAVADLRGAGHRVLFVGDGVNDAPAMATADAGIALGRKGSDLTVETADAVVLRDDLAAVPAVVALARRARRVVVANLVIAGSIIVALVTWDLVGTLPLPLGVAGHEGSTVLVALNGLRLLSKRSWPSI